MHSVLSCCTSLFSVCQAMLPCFIQRYYIFCCFCSAFNHLMFLHLSAWKCLSTSEWQTSFVIRSSTRSNKLLWKRNLRTASNIRCQSHLTHFFQTTFNKESLGSNYTSFHQRTNLRNIIILQRISDGIVLLCIDVIDSSSLMWNDAWIFSILSRWKNAIKSWCSV